MERAAESLVGNVGQLLAGQYRLLRGVGGAISELRDDLATMNALLRLHSEAEDGDVDCFTQEWTKQVRELAYDSEDHIDHYVLRIKCGGRSDWLRRLFQTLFRRHSLAGEVKDLRIRAAAVAERHARYGVNREALLKRRSLLPAPPVAALRHAGGDHHHPVGIDDQADALVERLNKGQADEEDQKNLKVFSIVGFGGLGKTTLAMHVCRLLESVFPCQAMASVSQAFDPATDLKGLLKRVLEQVLKPKTENLKPKTENAAGVKEELSQQDIGSLDEKELNRRLNEFLRDKRYLIVIDDVWTIRAWEAIQSMFHENNTGSRIIVTTRIETVAQACSPATIGGHYIHHMKFLKGEDSKNLFVSRVFGSSEKCPEQFEEVMGNILKKCGGLPLAIVSIASVLACYPSPESIGKWEQICKSIGYHMESHPTLEGMKHIITLSYNHLPYELKACMQYLSIFPEDYEIEKDRLLHRWIAEGLVLEQRGLSLMDVAESYFDELVSRNMIQPGRFSPDGTIDSCRVHDMLLEIAVSKALKSNFVSLVGGQYAGMTYDRIRRLSIQGDDGSRLSNGAEHTHSMSKKKMMVGRDTLEMDVKHVRSLSMFQLQGHYPLDYLDKFTLLRVLDLEGCSGLTNKHVEYICRLYLLKYLNLSHTKITKVPPQVRNLEHLQVLDVRGTYGLGLHGLSDKVTELKKLEYLLCKLHVLPKGIGKMKALRVMKLVVLECDETIAEEFGQLDQLERLDIIFQFDNARNQEDVILRKFAESLGKMRSLRQLTILDWECGDSDRLNFLQDLETPPRLLRHLTLWGILGDKAVPKWVGQLTYLVEFMSSETGLSGDQPFSALCNLPSLKVIRLGWNSYIDDELVARTDHKFPSLIYLEVSSFTHKDPISFVFEEGCMLKLEKLMIYFGSNKSSQRRISGIEHLASLKEVCLTERFDASLAETLLGTAKEYLKDASKRNGFKVVVRKS